MAGSSLTDTTCQVTLHSLRDQIGIVLQETTLFAATLRENIAFGCPDATRRDCRRRQGSPGPRVHRRIPGGYDTEVGERGVTLSGGQKQRIAIARALLKDPRILILDDATSSVDTETEQQIQTALERLMEGRTSFVIAQRLSTVRAADLILVLERGRVAARGTHAELLRSLGFTPRSTIDSYGPNKRKRGRRQGPPWTTGCETILQSHRRSRQGWRGRWIDEPVFGRLWPSHGTPRCHRTLWSEGGGACLGSPGPPSLAGIRPSSLATHAGCLLLDPDDLRPDPRRTLSHQSGHRRTDCPGRLFRPDAARSAHGS